MGGLYNIAKKDNLLGTLDMVDNQIVVMLYRPTFTFNPTSDFVSTVTAYEVSGLNYVRKTLIGKSVVQDNFINSAVFTASNPTWSPLDIGLVAGALIFKQVTNDSDSILIAAFDLASPYMTNNGAFTIKWNSTGILVVT